MTILTHLLIDFIMPVSILKSSLSLSRTYRNAGNTLTGRERGGREEERMMEGEIIDDFLWILIVRILLMPM
jgi:hypothetical protein